jgi:hypothetical protein
MRVCRRCHVVIGLAVTPSRHDNAIGSDLGSKMVHPATHRLIGNHDSAFRQQILDVAEAQGEPDIKPDRLLDNLGRETVAAKADLGHHQWLRLKSRNGKPTDNVTTPAAQMMRAAARLHRNNAAPKTRRETLKRTPSHPAPQNYPAWL